MYLLTIAAAVRESFDVETLVPASAAPTLLRYWRERGIPMRMMAASLGEDPRPRWRDRVRQRIRKWQVDVAIWRATRQRDPRRTILHLDLAPWTFFFLIAWLTRRLPVVVTLHTGLPPVRGWRRLFWRAKLRALDRRANFRVMAASRHVLDSLTPFLPAARIARIPVAYSPAEVPDDLARAPRATPASASCEIATVGQFIDRKGPWILLAAARSLVEQSADLRFVWICGTPPSDADRERIASFGLGDRFACVSAESLGDTRAALYARMRAAAMFVLPSLEEGLPLALVEAMALGLPVIATRINGIPEAVTHDTDGLLVAPGDVSGLAAAIDRLYRDPGLRARLGAHARTQALAKFHPRHTAAATTAVYDSFQRVT